MRRPGARLSPIMSPPRCPAPALAMSPVPARAVPLASQGGSSAVCPVSSPGLRQARAGAARPRAAGSTARRASPRPGPCARPTRRRTRPTPAARRRPGSSAGWPRAARASARRGAGQDLHDGRLVEAERVLVLGEGRDEQLRERVHLVLVVADLAQRLREVPVAGQHAPDLGGAVAPLLFLQVLERRVAEQPPVLLPVPRSPRELADQPERVHLPGTEPLGQLLRVLGRVHDHLRPRVGRAGPFDRLEQRPVQRHVRAACARVLDLAEGLVGDGGRRTRARAASRRASPRTCRAGS